MASDLPELQSVPLGRSAHQNFGTGHKAAMLDENWQCSGNIWWLRSTNGQVYPAWYTISGVWAPGDVAVCRVTWGAIVLNFSHTVVAGDTNLSIAQALRAKMNSDPTLIANKITVEQAGNYGDGHNPATWHIGFDWPIFRQNFHCATNGSNSANGAITPTQAVNLLDMPGCMLRLSRAVDGRPQRANDFLTGISFEGQTSQPVGTNVQQIYGTIQVYCDNPDPAHPQGRWQFQSADPGPNNVLNRWMFRQGVYVCDAKGNVPHGGHEGDMGPGTVNVATGYFVNGASLLDRIAALEARIAALEADHVG